MATSGCPAMNFLKPMARYHLPFATREETIVRSVSMYLLRQYFEHKKGRTPALELSQLDDKYSMIGNVNKGIVNRINSILKGGDANQNAMVILDSIGKMLSFAIDESLEDYEYLFEED